MVQDQPDSGLASPPFTRILNEEKQDFSFLHTASPSSYRTTVPLYHMLPL